MANECPSVRRIQQIVKQFEDGTRVTYSRIAGQGRHITSELRKNSVRRVEEAFEDYKNLSLSDLADMLDLSESMIYRILTEDLQKI